MLRVSELCGSAVGSILYTGDYLQVLLEVAMKPLWQHRMKEEDSGRP